MRTSRTHRRITHLMGRREPHGHTAASPTSRDDANLTDTPPHHPPHGTTRTSRTHRRITHLTGRREPHGHIAASPTSRDDANLTDTPPHYPPPGTTRTSRTHRRITHLTGRRESHGHTTSSREHSHLLTYLPTYLLTYLPTYLLRLSPVAIKRTQSSTGTQTALPLALVSSLIACGPSLAFEQGPPRWQRGRERVHVCTRPRVAALQRGTDRVLG